MIYTAPSTTFEATAEGFPSGLTGTIGVRLLDNIGGTTTARTTTGITEFPAGSGFYTVTLTAPATAGQYTVFWDTGAVGPSTTAAEDVTVTSSTTIPLVSGVVSLIAEAVVTPSEMLRFLDRTGLTGAQSVEEIDWITELINSFSLAAARFCNRQFTPERASVGAGAWPLQTAALVTAEPKEFLYKGAGYLSFSPYEPRTVTSILVGSDLLAASQWPLSAGSGSAEAEFRLEPAEKTSLGTWLYALIPPIDVTGSKWSRLVGRRVRVTGDWGPLAAPEDVKHAVKIAVAQGFRNPEGYASRDSGGLEITEQAERFPGSLPPESRALLNPYRRPS